jgi:CheY-like chemotaxis protein
VRSSISSSTPVLVIDDDEDIRTTLRMVLEIEGGCVVMEAADGTGALTLLCTSPPLARGPVRLSHAGPRWCGPADVAERLRWLPDQRACICLTVAKRAALPTTLLGLLARYDVPLVSRPFEIDDLLAAVYHAQQRLNQQSACWPWR